MLFNIAHFSEDNRYAGAVGRVRGLESQLLSNSRMHHLLQAGPWQSILHELRDTPYDTLLAGVHDSHGIRQAIEQVFSDRSRVINALAEPERNLIQALFRMTDFNNLITLANSSLQQRGRRVALSPRGLISPEALEKCIEQNRQLPVPLEKSWNNARLDYERHQNLFRVEMLLWKGYLDHLYSEYEQSRILFLRTLISYAVDIIVILYAIRWRYWLEAAPSSEADHFRNNWDLFPVGWTLPKDKIQSLMVDEIERIPQIFQYTPYGAIFAGAAEALKRSEALWQLEVSLENLLTEMCKLARYTAFGIEPLLAYLWFSRQESRNMRLILLGIFRNLDPVTIQSRLRMVYG